MHIEKIAIEGIPPIVNTIELDCDERVNLFIGPNASGKSTILRAIGYIHSPSNKNPLSQSLNDKYDYLEEEKPRVAMEPSEDWPCKRAAANSKNEGVPLWYKVPLLQIPATRVNLASIPDALLDNNPIELVQHMSGGVDLQTDFGIDSDADPVVFESHKVAYYILGLLQIRVALAQRIRYQLDRVIQAGYTCARSICREVIRDYAPHPFIELNEWAARQDDLNVYASMGIGTTDDYYGGKPPLYLGSLSAGTQGTLIWIWYLALKMARHYDWKEGWEKESAILLIDEIENHLHPTWQRRVIPALLEHFPKLQIFATTHSPFVVAGLKAGQVHLLRREIGGVTATTNTEDIIGWTMDEILRAMMGVTDPTDDVTARAAEELRELRSQEPLADEQAEQHRQRRMRELRQRVNRELLAGGPEAAQREEFEQQFADALQRYQERQSLDQDSG